MTSVHDFVINILAPFCFGACIGSFLNVCIYRIPLQRSVVYPGSHCAVCGTPIPWYNNIPIISWFMLKGRADCCGTRIDGRYPVVELFTAIVTVAIWQVHGTSPFAALAYLGFAYALIVASFVDIDHFYIPDRISLGGIPAGILCSVLVPSLQGTYDWGEAIKLSFVGAVAGAGLLLGVAILGTILFRKEAMGMGDVKLMATLGAFLGPLSPIYILAVSSILGSLLGIALLLRKGRFGSMAMPYGPFLAGAALIWILGGRQWMIRYLHGSGLEWLMGSGV